MLLSIIDYGMYRVNKYLLFFIFHLNRTLQFDLMLENELCASTLFLMGINDSLLDLIGFRALCRKELWSKTEVPLYLSSCHRTKFER